MPAVTITKGDSLDNVQFAYKNGDTPIDLTGYTATMSCRDLSGNLLFQATATGLGSNGVIAPLEPSSVTQELPLGTFNFDIFITNGTNSKTIISDQLEVKQSLKFFP